MPSGKTFLPSSWLIYNKHSIISQDKKNRHLNVTQLVCFKVSYFTYVLFLNHIQKDIWLKPSLSFHFSTPQPPQTLFTFLPWPIQSKNLDDHPHHDSPLIKSKSWLRNSLESREYFVKFLKLETFGPKRLFQGRHWFASLTTVECNFTVTKIQEWLSNFDLRLSNIELLLATFIYLAQCD